VARYFFLFRPDRFCLMSTTIFSFLFFPCQKILLALLASKLSSAFTVADEEDSFKCLSQERIWLVIAGKAQMEQKPLMMAPCKSAIQHSYELCFLTHYTCVRQIKWLLGKRSIQVCSPVLSHWSIRRQQVFFWWVSVMLTVQWILFVIA